MKDLTPNTKYYYMLGGDLARFHSLKIESLGLIRYICWYVSLSNTIKNLRFRIIEYGVISPIFLGPKTFMLQGFGGTINIPLGS